MVYVAQTLGGLVPPGFQGTIEVTLVGVEEVACALDGGAKQVYERARPRHLSPDDVGYVTGTKKLLDAMSIRQLDGQLQRITLRPK